MAESEKNIVHVGEWPGIPDLFLISLSPSGMEKLRIIHRKGKEKVLFRKILQDLLNQGFTKALIEASELQGS